MLRVFGVALMFGSHVVVARVLDLKNYGDYIYITTLITVASLAGILGFKGSAFRFIPVYFGSSQWKLLGGFVRRGFQITFLWSSLMAIVGFIVTAFVSDSSDPEFLKVIYLACILFPFYVILQVSGAFLLALKRIYYGLIPATVFRPAFIAAGAIAMFYYAGSHVSAFAVMLVNMAITIFVLIISYRYLNKVTHPLVGDYGNSYETREWLRVSIPLMLVSSFHVILTNADIIMIGSMLGAKETAVYSAAGRIVLLVSFGLVSVNTISSPIIADLYARKKFDELQRIITFVARGIFLFTLPVCMVIFVWGGSMLLIFGESFVQGFGALKILAVGQLFDALAGPVLVFMSVTGHQKELAYILAVSVIINILANFFLIPAYGVEGAAIASTFSMVIWNLVMVIYINMKSHIRMTVFSRVKAL